jgi:carnitine 3-dehydrogenase
MKYRSRVNSVAVIGLGTIGMSWSAYFLARGFRVRGYDPDPQSADRTLGR